MSNRNVFRGMFDALVEARSRQAAAYVRNHMELMDDNDRRRSGFPTGGRRF
ncbi:hypothetical protein [Notoacmeibacter marinus]|uniref:hypothetical protein n=1 Tax=Notoacmeibacter marinus TaxID=1876515 RepID=UPI001303BD51|nr:hypothetical protein [Notoacmeibacter marinus]